MKHEREWKRVNFLGLYAYEISTDGGIRTNNGERYIPTGMDEEGFKVVMLNYRGKRKKFHIHKLLYDTFKIVSNEVPIKRMAPPPSHSKLSDNEDDYGKGVNSRHWIELKEEIKRVEILRFKADQNEKRNNSNLESF